MQASWQVLCSTGAFTRERLLTNHRIVLEYGSALDVDGLELLFFADWYPQVERVAADLGAAGLRFPVLHLEKSIGGLLGSAEPAQRVLALQRLERNCWVGEQLGVALVVLHLWGMPGSDEQLERNLEALGECLRIAGEAGLEVAVETIPCLRSDPLTNARRAVALAGRTLIALDTEFLALHGQLEEALAADWLWSGNRVRHVHIKDYDGQMADASGYRRYLHPGEGRIDFPGFFAGLAARGFAGSISLEASVVRSDGVVDLPRLQASLAHLRTLLVHEE